ncbi:MarR family winged helix-turn-helix transcriptional regulator [Thalassococcus sp. S3]|uniref:MarR family winged helix-turn-helix transcriptional regulator n=1 Tax=Thalassococcus sp. S3 TaxID=2017482 RepID=UPI00102467FB|nr:MarR family transcriptional regulator [Thalassococcus sp. S3]QBF32027.1 MarR family transcriptional regulator [Thalassococcus sp. S3]
MSERFPKPELYRLTEQVGFNLRRANQRHVAIFARHVTGLTPTQFAAIARLYELGALSQNRLGRLTAMDSATIKGVVERLAGKGLVQSRADAEDQRLRIVALTDAGKAAFLEAHDQALKARAETLQTLTEEEAAQLEALLEKLV